MERACPDRLSHFLVAKGLYKSFLYLVCRLIGKGDGENRPRGTRLGYKLRKNFRDLIGRERKSSLKLRYVILRNFIGNKIREVGVAVFDNVRYSVYKYGSFTAARSRKNKERPFNREYRAALLGIKKCSVRAIKQGALRTQISIFHFLLFFFHYII